MFFKFYIFLKFIERTSLPLRCIVSSRHLVTYGVAKELASIFQPLVGRSNHHVQNMQNFMESIQDIKLHPGECKTSYDLTALFTSVPVKKALTIVHKKLVQDHRLTLWTKLTIQHIIECLAFCLHNIHFLFQDTYHEQAEGTSMGPPVSPIIANIYMEYFQDGALGTAWDPTRLWKRYLYDTFLIQYTEHKEQFLQHISNIDSAIKLRVEDTGEKGSMPLRHVLSVS